MHERSCEREALVAALDQTGCLNDPRLEEAMLAVPRHHFAPPEVTAAAYQDCPLPVGFGQTMSAPHMVVMMCTALQLEPGHRVLEIGAGAGYHAAVVKQLVQDGHVVSLEYVPELADIAAKNLAAAGSDVTVIARDGRLGAQEFAPFDAVYVTCAIPHIPTTLVSQLREGGHFVAPVGLGRSRLMAGRRIHGELELDDLGGCMFVPAQGMLGDVDDGDAGMLVPSP